MKYGFCSIGIIAAIGLIGCSSEGAGNSGENASQSSAAIGTVNGCIGQAKACIAAAKSPADLDTCNQDLRACLSTLLPDAGALPVFDAGVSPIPPLPDAGVPPLPSLPDAALPPLPAFDAGQVAAAVKACVDALGVCLNSGTDPMTCADQARTCLQQAI